MPEQKANIAITNEVIQEMSGLADLQFSMPAPPSEMNEAERILSRMAALNLLLSYVATGKYLDDYLAVAGIKPDKLNASWWKQFKHIRESAPSRYSKNARYAGAAFARVTRPGDNELLAVNDLGAISRTNLSIQCGYLMSALHPDADHSFFRAAIQEIPNYIKRKTHPKFTEAPELTVKELKEMDDLCAGVLSVYKEDTSREAAEVVAQYVAERYAPKESASLLPPPINFSKLGNRLLDISDRTYQFALSPRPGSKSYVQPIPKDVMCNLSFDERTGMLSSAGSSDAALQTLYGTIENRNTSEIISNHDFLFLRTALTAIYRNPETIDQNYVTVKRTELGKHLGIDLSAGNSIDVVAKMKPLENLIGRTPDGSWWRVFVSMGYNQQTDSFTFACPFINKIVLNLEEAHQQSYTSKKRGEVKYISPHFNLLIHSDIYKERNKRAIEIVLAITNLLLQRAGETTKKPAGKDKFTAHIKYSTLISYCTELDSSLSQCARPSNRNRILQTAFKKAEELLRTHTDAYSHFTDLHIPPLIVSNSTIEDTINITFTGINTSD